MKILAWIEEIRPSWLFGEILRAAAIMFLAADGTPNMFLFSLGLVLAILYQGAGVTLNDYYDIEVDKLNAPNRPLPSGRLSPKEVKYFGVGCIILAILISLVNPMVTLIGIGFILPLGWGYNKFFKNTPLGPLVFSLQCGIGYVVAGALFIANKISDPIIFLSISLLTCLFGNIVSEGLSDIEGDRIARKHTIAVVYGVKVATIIAFLFHLASVLILIFGALLGIFPVSVFIVAFIPLALVFITYIYIALKPIQSSFIKSRKMLKPLLHLLCLIPLIQFPNAFMWILILSLSSAELIANILEYRT
jgi:geranylgeranylglycerol-phosphate geranylgeranyltransferase